ncbi:MAG: hypothetical protein EOO16_01850 [Chitinophagaceae bacterium]|nr:MAG: hypothetical protein EOO16_01850 [Chitinophagaceae bacterium]
MNRMLLTITILAVLLLAATAPTRAQAARVPRWAPVKGYWVVENNVKTPDRCTVFFYNNDHELVYEEAIEKTLNLDRRRTLLRLNRVLEAAVAGHERRMACPSGLLASQFTSRNSL